MEEQQNLFARITCPTLLVRGTESWASDPVADGRINAFKATNPTSVNIENAGHWVHHDQLAEFVTLVDKFLAE